MFAVFVLVLIFVLKPGGDSGSPAPSARPTAVALPALSDVAAPPHGGDNASACAKLIEALPTSLSGLAPRAVYPHPDSPFVVAWGDPAIVLRCGVDRPAGLVAGADQLLAGVNGVYYWVDHGKNTTTFTAVDRAPYIEVTVPTQYAGGPLSPVSDAINKTLPAVCKVDPAADTEDLCTRRP